MKKGPASRYTALGLLAFCALLLWLAATRGGAVPLDPWTAWERLLWPLLRLSLLIGIGLFVALVIEAAGWTERLAVMARPFMRWGHLSPAMGSAFTTAFFSGTAALAMLATFLREGAMNRREVTISVLLDTFPSYFLHLPVTFFVILPLVGKAGLLYLLLTFGAAFLRFGAVLVYTRITFPAMQEAPPRERGAPGTWRELLENALIKLLSRLSRILLIVAPVYTIMLLVTDLGFFHWLRNSLALGVESRLFPVEGVSVIILSLMAEITSGYAAAGAMLESGTLSLGQTVLALLAGQIIGTPLRALRHQLPYYVGVFSPAMGIRLMAAAQIFRLASLGIVTAGFILGMRACGGP
ncbi:MAG: nucleoside recognition protein [Thermodesulfobacteriota bacterium]